VLLNSIEGGLGLGVTAIPRGAYGLILELLMDIGKLTHSADKWSDGYRQTYTSIILSLKI